MAYIKLNLDALFHNLKVIDKKSGGNFAVVLKDNAYGHGLEEIGSEAKKFGVKRAVVRNFKEAKRIENFFPYILILSDTPKVNNFCYALNDIESIKKTPKGALVELKVDTGMHRNGVRVEEVKRALELILSQKAVLKGVFTHYRSADDLSSELFWQREKWREVKREVKRFCFKNQLPLPHFHSSNSATLFRAGVEDGEFARVGIATYGYLEMDKIFNPPLLKPVLTLWAKRISTRTLYEGERVGYGGEFVALQKMVVSSYDVGYADGIFRALKTTAAGKILGRVSMDSIVLEGQKDEVCIFEDVKEIAKEHHTIAYEVLVKLSPTLERKKDSAQIPAALED